MRTIVVDDEPLARKRIITLLDKINEIDVIEECSNGKSAILSINSLKPELIFLDINMKDLNGFNVLEQITIKPKPIIIFVTAYNEHALSAFDFEAFDFLLKPFKEERFYQTIVRVLQLQQKDIQLQFDIRLKDFLKESFALKEKETSVLSYLPIRLGNKTILLKPSKIMYILASGYHAEIYTIEKKHVMRESLSNLEEILEGDFFRVHRSAIVNLNYIKELIHSGHSEIDVNMEDNRLISISNSKKRNFLDKFRIKQGLD